MSEKRNTEQLAEDIRRGVDDLMAAVDNLPTKADWTLALLSSLSLAAVTALILAIIGRLA